MNAQPFVSVIIPVYNGAEFLLDALASIRAQNYAPLEILVMDDGSTDNTKEIAQAQTDVLYFALEHRGAPATRRRGVDAARGELIAFLDVDDLWSKNKLARQVVLLNENPNVAIVNGYTQLLRLVDANASEWKFEVWGTPQLAFSFGSALFRRTVFEIVSSFDDAQSMTDDLDWFSHAREKNVPMLIHADVMQFYRRHTRNMTNNVDLGKQQLLQMLKKSLARREANAQASGSALPDLDIRAAT